MAPSKTARTRPATSAQLCPAANATYGAGASSRGAKGSRGGMGAASRRSNTRVRTPPATVSTGVSSAPCTIQRSAVPAGASIVSRTSRAGEPTRNRWTSAPATGGALSRTAVICSTTAPDRTPGMIPESSRRCVGVPVPSATGASARAPGSSVATAPSAPTTRARISGRSSRHGAQARSTRADARAASALIGR